MMKRVKILFITILTLAGCQLEENFEQFDDNAVPMTFYAGIELPEDHVDTKTILGGSTSDKYRKVLWETDDEVYVTNETYSSKFVNKAEDWANLAILEGELSQAKKYFAAYPYDIVTNYTSGGFNVNLPAVQEYYEDGIAPGTFPMVAKCNNGTFNFQNVCGIFVLQLLGDKTISAITFSGEDETGNLHSVAGNSIISMDYEDSPSLVFTDGAKNSVKLNCPNGVTLNNSTPTLFHIILPSGTYRDFKVVVEATDGSIMTITSTKPLRIKRSTRTTAAELTYGDVIDLSEEGTANCYVINNPGNYKFNASVKGNGSESVGTAATAEVLWESFGTSVKPEVGSVVKNVKYVEGNIKFDIPVNYNEGNAVIAVKNSSGTILWSWHIWVTDMPKEYEYPNNAGVMMDRNLGATSATPGDVGALGLFYEWGRKDPFLASSSTNSNVVAESTLNWPTAVENTSSTGTIQFSVENPTTFIKSNSSLNGDWLQTRNDQIWQSEKTMYDPCPPGWKVPDGGPNGFFKIAGFDDTMFDKTNYGIYFNCSSSVESWFPAAGQGDGGIPWGTGTNGLYAGNRYNGGFTYRMSFRLTENEITGDVAAHGVGGRGVGHSVRCVKEVSGPSADISECVDLSSDETANSYIVSEVGSYKFNASVKGNTNDALGAVSTAEVLWESFGTDYPPLEGEIIKNVSYENGYIRFDTPSRLTEGNAVVAAKDASGKILWSWHIWFTDKPVEHVYPNGTGTLMDRNLGATSATPGDVGALGLLYQWGRKDPFLNSSEINQGNSSTVAKSTGTWNQTYVGYDIGTIEYVTEHPMTFIIPQDYNDREWLYYSKSNLWAEEKTVYDPCPPGWQVPRSSSTWNHLSQNNYEFDEANCGIKINLNGSVAWYPAAGYKAASLMKTGTTGFYRYSYSGYMSFKKDTESKVSLGKGDGMSVRCIKTGSNTNNEISVVDLSSNGTANSYIVSNPGKYKFNATVKGNGTESVGVPSVAEVIWESFGTDVTPSIGDVIKNVRYQEGFIELETSESFNEGNAVVAVKDASGTILWSWHIWVTDMPQEQVYYHNAGILMDRNLGATSATPGSVGTLGLLYQWGRKDPFLAAYVSDGVNAYEESKSTITWPASVHSKDSNNGTIDYSIENPTTFIKYNTYNYDWYYTGSKSTFTNRWSENKTIYDPCPVGWRVPDGDENGVWANALGSSSSYNTTYGSEGVNFSGILGDATTIWYPSMRSRNYDDGKLSLACDGATYWTCTTIRGSYSYYNAYYFSYSCGEVNPANYARYFATGNPIRCVKDDNPTIDILGATDLTIDGSANSYIISKSGAYSFKALKGNSSESVGSVVSVDVLWESFGTDVKPSKGDLINVCEYKNDKIYFKTSEIFKEGNAVIAAKDESGEILWSWHIWFTDKPVEHVYPNGTGTLMDRNLGATSAIPGDVGALGLLYQWGRKDPFLNSSDINPTDYSAPVSKSTGTWTEEVASSSTGNVDYVTKNPTTFIRALATDDYDWFYHSPNNSLWDDGGKTIYDPCPVGWMVPRSTSAWSSDIFNQSEYDNLNCGINTIISSDTKAWYSSSGYRYNAGINYVGTAGYYWTTSQRATWKSACLMTNETGFGGDVIGRGYALAVRCVKSN